MDIFSTILNLPIAQILGLIFAVGLAEKMGVPIISIAMSFLKKNGNGTSKKLGEIDEHLEILTSNHIDHLQKGIDKLLEMQEKENVTLALMAQSLEDIKDKMK